MLPGQRCWPGQCDWSQAKHKCDLKHLNSKALISSHFPLGSDLFSCHTTQMCFALFWPHFESWLASPLFDKSLQFSNVVRLPKSFRSIQSALTRSLVCPLKGPFGLTHLAIRVWVQRSRHHLRKEQTSDGVHTEAHLGAATAQFWARCDKAKIAIKRAA